MFQIIIINMGNQTKKISSIIKSIQDNCSKEIQHSESSFDDQNQDQFEILTQELQKCKISKDDKIDNLVYKTAEQMLNTEQSSEKGQKESNNLNKFKEAFIQLCDNQNCFKLFRQSCFQISNKQYLRAFYRKSMEFGCSEEQIDSFYRNIIHKLRTQNSISAITLYIKNHGCKQNVKRALISILISILEGQKKEVDQVQNKNIEIILCLIGSIVQDKLIEGLELNYSLENHENLQQVSI